MNACFITFRSVTTAQRGERCLARGGVDCRLMRTPRWMEERGCGYCLRLQPGDVERSLRLLQGEGVGYSKVYRSTPEGSVELWQP